MTFNSCNERLDENEGIDKDDSIGRTCKCPNPRWVRPVADPTEETVLWIIQSFKSCYTNKYDHDQQTWSITEEVEFDCVDVSDRLKDQDNHLIKEISFHEHPKEGRQKCKQCHS